MEFSKKCLRKHENRVYNRSGFILEMRGKHCLRKHDSEYQSRKLWPILVGIGIRRIG